jgi:phospholipid/cholesterol/gamma-HCH transport system substrate-binding protein
MIKQQSKLELIVGVFVLAGLVAIGWLALDLGRGAFVAGDAYTVTAEFANTGSLTTGSNVVIAGVPVGRVTKVALNPKNFRAVVSLEVERAVQLPTDSIASVKTAGLIGDKYISIAPGGDPDMIKPDGIIAETESDVDIASLISRFAFGAVQSPAPPEKK